MDIFYDPRFNKNPKGGYNDKSAVCSIKGGSDAYLLENELNELQWIQLEKIKGLVSLITTNGFLDIGKQGQDSNGSLNELGTRKLNSFYISPFTAILNGQIVNICSTEEDGKLVITLDEPPTHRKEKRYDLVYLEFWESEVSYRDKLYTYGGIENDILENYAIFDSDINVETSRRIQFQWRINVKSNIDINTYPNGFESTNGVINENIIPLGKSSGDNLEYIYTKNQKMKNIYVAGNESMTSKEYFNSIDGYIYAIPIVIVKRLNNAGYDLIDNPEGSRDYIDETSIPENDGKFSNVIYVDQIIDLREPSYLGIEQYLELFVTNNTFNEYKQYIENLFEVNFDSLFDKLQELYDYVHGYIKTDLDKKLYRSEFELWLNDILLKIDEINKKINRNIEILEDHEQRIKKLEDFLAKVGYDPDVEFFVKYGIAIRRKSIFLPGGSLQKNVQNEDVIISEGVSVDTNLDSSESYIPFYTIYDESKGKAGDIWFEKSDTSFLVKNTGQNDFLSRIYSLDLTWKADQNNIRSGKDVFSENGTIINQPISDTDFIIITPIECIKGENGDISISIEEDHFTVNNTGSNGNEFNWFVINTSKLRNVTVIDLELNGVNNNIIVTGEFGDDFDIVVGNIVRPQVDGTLGEIYVSRSHNSFSVKYTGTAICTIRCLVLREVIL